MATRRTQVNTLLLNLGIVTPPSTTAKSAATPSYDDERAAKRPKVALPAELRCDEKLAPDVPAPKYTSMPGESVSAHAAYPRPSMGEPSLPPTSRGGSDGAHAPAYPMPYGGYNEACNNCGMLNHWARECPNVPVKMLAKKTDCPCALCGENVRIGDRISKLGRGRNMNRWGHERCVLSELVASSAIEQADAQRALRVAPRGFPSAARM